MNSSMIKLFFALCAFTCVIATPISSDVFAKRDGPLSVQTHRYDSLLSKRGNGKKIIGDVLNVVTTGPKAIANVVSTALRIKAEVETLVLELGKSGLTSLLSKKGKKESKPEAAPSGQLQESRNTGVSQTENGTTAEGSTAQPPQAQSSEVAAPPAVEEDNTPRK